MSRLRSLNTRRAPLLKKASLVHPRGHRFFVGMVAALGATLAWLYMTGAFSRIHQAASSYADRKLSLYGMTLSHIHIKNRHRTSLLDLQKNIGRPLGTPFPKIDLGHSQQSLQSLPWVKSVTLERRWPHTLVITLQEKVPLALWQHHQKIKLVDQEGSSIPVQDLEPFRTYPLLIGEGAPTAAASFFQQLGPIEFLKKSVAAYVRVGQRRWNLRLKSGLTILLPEEHTEEAIQLLARLYRTKNIEKLAKKTLDLRVPQKIFYQ